MIPGWLKALGAAGVVVIAAAIAFAVLEPIQVLPRIRLAPGYALDADDGSTFTSEDVRGRLTLYTFATLGCDDCDEVERTMTTVGDRVGVEIDLGGVDFELVTIVLDPDTPTLELRDRAERAGARDNWTWVTADEATLRTVVGAGFQRYYEPADGDIAYDPGYVIVDGNGIVRGDYRYSTLADDADKLVRHLDILATELRNSHGATSVAYEAAHLFLCYP